MEEKNKDLGEIQVYELGYHIIPSIPEENLPSEVSKIHSFIQDGEGVVIGENAPSLRQLAYDIRKKIDTKSLNFNKAYFGWIKFEMERSKVENLKKNMDSNMNILRFLIIKTVKENTLSSIKIQNYKKEKDEVGTNENDVQEKVEIDEKEIDKSIDELVVDENL